MRSRALGTLLFVAALVCAAFWFQRDTGPRPAAPTAPLAAESVPERSPARADLAAPQPQKPEASAASARTQAEAGGANRPTSARDNDVRVHVTTREGAPVAQAEITLFEEPYPSWTARPTEQTTADGRALMERVLYGPYHLAVRHKDYGGVRLGPLSTPGEHVVVLDPAAQLAVAVIDEQGQHLHSVTVHLTAHEHDSLERGETHVSDTRADGWVHFNQLRPGNYAITATPSGGLLSSTQTMWLVAGPNELVLRARRGLMAYGIVVSDDAEGTPLAEATLALDTRPSWHPTSSADGRFALPVEGAGERVLVKAAGHAPVSLQVPALALQRPEAGQSPAWRIVVPREVVLKGRVTMRDGFAVKAEVICIERNADTPARRAETGENGTFALYGVTPERSAVLIVKSSYLAPVMRAIETPTAGSADLGTFVLLERGAQLRVLARDARGKLLSGARVVVLEATPPECVGLEETQHALLLDAQGSAHFDNLAAGATEVQLWPRGSKSPLMRSVELQADQTAQVVFEETTGAVLQGLVVGPDGKPVHGAAVSVDPLERDPALAHGDSETDGTGAYLVSGLDVAREYHITVWPPKPVLGERALRGGVYGPMKPGTDSIRIELEELPWRTLLVRSKDGTPMVGAEIEVLPLQGRPSEGQLRDPAIPTGEVLVTDAAGLVRTPWPSDTPMRAIVRSAGRTLATAEIDWGVGPDPYPLDAR